MRFGLPVKDSYVLGIMIQLLGGFSVAFTLSRQSVSLTSQCSALVATRAHGARESVRSDHVR